MREVSRLEDEIILRLKNVGITELVENRVEWEENTQKPLILKVRITTKKIVILFRFPFLL